MKLVHNEIKTDPQMDEKRVLFYPIPNNLDIRNIILAEPVKGARCESEPEKQADRAIYILGMMSVVRFRNRDEYENDLSFVRLSSKVLKQYVRKYNRYLEYFMEKGIIEVNKSYQAGSYCKGYRFSEKYRGELMNNVKIRDVRFISRIRMLDSKTGKIRLADIQWNVKEQRVCDPENVVWDYPTLIDTLGNISIDIYGACRQLCDEVKSKQIAISKANRCLYSLNSVHHGSIYFKKDKVGGRVHTTITSFTKEYRKFLKHPKVRSWVKLDVSCCQAYLLGCILYENTLSTYIFSNYLNNNTPIMWTAYENLPDDAREYISVCTRGLFYEDLAEKMWRMKGKRYTREQIKDKLLKCLFEPIHWDNLIKEVFRISYPSVFKFIAEINRNFKVTKKISRKLQKAKPDENKLAVLLQRAESYIILDHVVKEIGNVDEEIPVLTIHDELMVPEERTDLVIGIMKNEFLRLTNSVPKIKCEVIQSPVSAQAA